MLIESSLSSVRPVVALACKRYNRQHLDLERILTRGMLHTCVLAVAISGKWQHKSKATLEVHLDARYGMIGCECIKLLSLELRVSVKWLMKYLNLKWDTLLCLFSLQTDK